MRNIDHGREARRKTRDAISKIQTAANPDPGVPRSFLPQAEGIERASKRRPVQPPPYRHDRRKKNKKLSRYDATYISLSQKQEQRRESRIILDPACQPFRNSAKQRKRTKR